MSKKKVKEVRPLREYSLEDLLEELDQAIRVNHYDPEGNMEKTPYTLLQYKMEIIERFDALEN